MKTIRFLLLLIAFAPIQAQRGALSPSPLWPGDQNGGVDRIPADVLKTHFVYYDVNNGQLVLVYDNGDGKPKVRRRLNLNNAVAPSMTFSVAKNKNNPQAWDYVYKVSNDGKKGKAAIAEMLLVVGDTAATFQAPQRWQGSVGPSQIPAVKGPLGGHAGAVVHVFKNDPLGNLTDLAPGTSMTGLVVTSTFKPGFTLAYFNNDNPNNSIYGGLDDVPESVIQQIAPWQQVDMNSKAVFTMGPKFGPDTRLQLIVSDYRAGIQRLILDGELQASSPFVQAVQTTLNNYTQAVRSAPPDTAPSDFVGPALTFSVAPTTALETQLLSALEAAMTK